jgi:hypothetical protein
MSVRDLTDERFGILTVVERAGTYRRQYEREGRVRHLALPTWLVRCDCGEEKVVVGSNLKNGRTKSCGCRGRTLV